MELSQQILFFVGALGVFNGFILGLYFLAIKKKNTAADRWFGMLLLALAVRIGKSVLKYFDPTTSEWVLQIGLSSCLFIGPALYFYTRSLHLSEYKVSKSKWYQILILFAFVLIGLVFNYKHYRHLWNPPFVIFIYTVWSAYVILAIYITKDLWRKLITDRSRLAPQDLWLMSLITANLIICAVFNSMLYFGVPSYISGPISFSFLFYILAGFILFSPLRAIIISTHKSSSKKPRKMLDNNLVQHISSELHRVMGSDKAFINPDLKLEKLATEIGTSTHLLSQYINDHLGKNFNTYINQLRVEEASKLLLSEEQYSFEGIANEVGFRSKSTFYAAFKNRFAMTPKAYIESH